MPSAVALARGRHGIQCIVRFQQNTEDDPTSINIQCQRLRGFAHALHIHEFGDISAQNASIGKIYNPEGKKHGAPQDAERDVGTIGNLIPDRDNFRVDTTIVSEDVKLSGPTSVIGRSIVIKQFRDDFGRGTHPTSAINGNSGEGIAFGVIGKA